MRLSEDTRRAIERDLEHPVLGAGMDDMLADRHGVSVSCVRKVRKAVRRDAALQSVYARARELAEILGWTGPLSELVEGVLAAEVARQHKATEYLRQQCLPQTGASVVAPDERGSTGKSRRSVQVATVSSDENSGSTASVPEGDSRHEGWKLRRPSPRKRGCGDLVEEECGPAST